MADNAALAMWTSGGKGVDRALEAVKNVALATGDYFESFVIVVFTNFTFSHNNILSRAVDGMAV